MEQPKNEFTGQWNPALRSVLMLLLGGYLLKTAYALLENLETPGDLSMALRWFFVLLFAGVGVLAILRAVRTLIRQGKSRKTERDESDEAE